MAESEFEAFNALRRLLVSIPKEAVPAAEDAAAQVYLNAAIAAAPRKTGTLAGSIKIIEGKIRATLSGDVRRVFVSPEKRKGYYGFFLEKGWRVPLGPRQTFYTKRGALARAARAKGLPGRAFTSRRLARSGRGAAHSQQGLTGYKQIPGRPWFWPAINAADSAAVQTAEVAFNEKLKELDSR